MIRVSLALCILLSLCYCREESCVLPGSSEGWTEFHIKMGKFAASPVIYETSGEAKGRWEVIFGTNCDYCGLQPLSECHDLMKACGDSFNPWSSSNKNSVMMTFRFLPADDLHRDSGQLQVSPYLNIDKKVVNKWVTEGVPDVKEDWPVVDVELGDTVAFQYVHRGDGLLDMQIDHKGEEYKVSWVHPNVSTPVRRINVWAGGTSKPVVDKYLQRRCINF